MKVWFPLKVDEFTDLCSVSNISVFILHDALHGYYVHGKSPYYGLADLNAEDLKRALDMEKEGGGTTRGLILGDRTALQTFEIFIPVEMR